MPTVVPAGFDCKGGWDQVSPTLKLNPGVVRDCKNFEVPSTGGYARIIGYERYDGQAAPSDATYTIIQVASFTNTPAAGQTLTGGGSGATSVIVYVGSNYMVVTKVAGGPYTIPEAVAVGATAIGTTETVTATITVKQKAQFTNLAADQYRADIAEVPGSGPVRGVVTYNDVRYAFRNNAGGTACDMYKSSGAGWVQVTFLYEVSFNTGNVTTPVDGETLTQGANSATVRRVCTESGAWTGSAAGRFVISAPAPGNFAAGAATLSGGATVNLVGIQTAITLLPGGQFEFDKANFYGQSSGIRLYGCDGVNRAFEFDGTYFVPIATVASPDTPTHIKEFKNHLHCQIGSSSFNSGIGTPFNWTTAAGGAETALGDTLTGYCEQAGNTTTGALTIFGQNNIFMLYGTSASDWNFVRLREGVGSQNNTAQVMADTYFFNDNGIGSLAATQAYGNFSSATLTDSIRKFIKGKRGTTAISLLCREKSQYRILFSDATALYCTVVNGKLKGVMQVKFGKAAFCAHSEMLTTGQEVMLIGSATDGYVYQLDKGTSFDGDAIDAYIKFNWFHAGSPRLEKRWRSASVEMQGDSYAAITLSTSLAYGSVDEMQPEPTNHEANFAETVWDDAAAAWDANLFWDAQSLTPTEICLSGTATNIEVTISSGTDYVSQYTVNSLIFHYTPRRIIRGISI